MQFWDSPTPPAEVNALIATWAPMHPGYDMVFFNDTSAQSWLAQHYDARYIEAYRACQHPAMKSDLFRLAYLYVSGGAYIDADERCRRSIEPLVRGGASLALNRRMALNGLTYINNAPIMCQSGLPLMLECLDSAVEAILAAHGRRLKVWVTTGPGNLSRAIAQHILNAERLPRILILDDWATYAEVVFCEYKYGARYWLTHDRFVESRTIGLKHLTLLWVARARRVAERQPIAHRLWQVAMSALTLRRRPQTPPD